MRILQEGEKSKAICNSCEELRGITYVYKDYTLKSGLKVPNVLQGICDDCGKAVTIPSQSTPKIKQYLEEKDVSLEVRIPRILEDVLYNIGYKSHLEVSQALKYIINFYSRKFNEPHNASNKKIFMHFIEDHPLLKDSRKSRISLRISKSVDDKINDLAAEFSLNKSQYILSLLLKAKEDLIENGNKRAAKEFYESAELLSN
jgi:hypothetical protein